MTRAEDKGNMMTSATHYGAEAVAIAATPEEAATGRPTRLFLPAEQATAEEPKAGTGIRDSGFGKTATPAETTAPLPDALHRVEAAKVLEDRLRAAGIPYFSVDEAKKASSTRVFSLFVGVKLKAFDFVVYNDQGPNCLVLVVGRRGATPQDRALMVRWEEVFGRESFKAACVQVNARGEIRSTGQDISALLTRRPEAPPAASGPKACPDPRGGGEHATRRSSR